MSKREDLKETIIAMVKAAYGTPVELARLLDANDINADSIAMRQRAADLIKDAKNKDEAICLLRDNL